MNGQQGVHDGRKGFLSFNLMEGLKMCFRIGAGPHQPLDKLSDDIRPRKDFGILFNGHLEPVIEGLELQRPISEQDIFVSPKVVGFHRKFIEGECQSARN